MEAQSVAPPMTGKVLIVDDSSMVRNVLKRILGEMRFEVHEAIDGREGLELADSGNFDLIITDVEMPVMTGYQLCAALKMNASTRSVPVIILSSLSSDGDIEHGFRVGASAYVPKDMAATMLGQRVQEVLSRAAFRQQRLIMVVDDSTTVRNLVMDGLDKEGFRVVKARDGVHALERLEECLPDLILTDIDMPRMDGLTLCRKLAEDRRFNAIPLVVMSSTNNMAKVQHMIQEGASTYIMKPFRVEQLINHLDRILSDHFRLALEARRRAEMESELILSSIASLVNALEARDPYTRGHSDRVASFSVRIGEQLGFDRAQLERLKLMGKLHDLGKIGVRDDILLKPARLTEEEFEEIKRHTVHVRGILEPIESLHDVMEAAVSHHERMDGTGYPNGLKGEEIPLVARIVAVADVYDALTTDRPYRPGMTKATALEIIQEIKGDHLCPKCVEAFFACFEKDVGVAVS